MIYGSMVVLTKIHRPQSEQQQDAEVYRQKDQKSARLIFDRHVHNGNNPAGVFYGISIPFGRLSAQILLIIIFS